MPDPASGSPAVTGASRRWPWTRPSTYSSSHPEQKAQVRVRPPPRAMRLDRRLYSAVSFPADCGFVAGTEGADSEPLDALVLPEDPTFPGCWVRARVVGVSWIRYDKEGESRREAKIITVAEGDPTFEEAQDWTSSPSTCCANWRTSSTSTRCSSPAPPGARRLRGPPGRPPRDRGGPGPRQAVRAQVIRVSPAPSARPGRAPWLLGCSAVHSA